MNVRTELAIIEAEKIVLDYESTPDIDMEFFSRKESVGKDVYDSCYGLLLRAMNVIGDLRAEIESLARNL